MKTAVFALFSAFTFSLSTSAAPTTQELINCARNRASAESVMADFKIIGQSLDLIENAVTNQKNYLVLFTAESRSSSTVEGSIQMTVGLNVDPTLADCIWKKNGKVFHAQLSQFQVKPKAID